MTRKEFPLLSLPLELRHQIYSELLIASLNEPVLLWHDRKGREKSRSIHPQILRVCKQINAEAKNLLYEHNMFRLDMTTPEWDFCTHSAQGPMKKSQALVRDDAVNGTIYFEQSGLLSASSLQRLAHVEIVIHPFSFWASRMGEVVRSGTGDLFVHLLRLLADAEDSDSLLKKKRLVITVYKQYYEFSPNGQKWEMFADGSLDKESPMAAKVRPLVEAVGKKRDIRIYEVLEDVRVDGDKHEREAQTVTREVSIQDFADL
ncbi:MAG: hypothetical protein Q9226_008462 [Calogaya cf. arnoldii]